MRQCCCSHDPPTARVRSESWAASRAHSSRCPRRCPTPAIASAHASRRPCGRDVGACFPCRSGCGRRRDQVAARDECRELVRATRSGSSRNPRTVARRAVGGRLSAGRPSAAPIVWALRLLVAPGSASTGNCSVRRRRHREGPEIDCSSHLYAMVSPPCPSGSAFRRHSRLFGEARHTPCPCGLRAVRRARPTGFEPSFSYRFPGAELGFPRAFRVAVWLNPLFKRILLVRPRWATSERPDRTTSRPRRSRSARAGRRCRR
jgi:hypothetical protein